jgi:hypothetical protein
LEAQRAVLPAVLPTHLLEQTDESELSARAPSLLAQKELRASQQAASRWSLRREHVLWERQALLAKQLLAARPGPQASAQAQLEEHEEQQAWRERQAQLQPEPTPPSLASALRPWLLLPSLLFPP